MNEQPITITAIRPGLDIRGLDRGQIPTADWLCTCGHHERARGADDVKDLTARATAGTCPHAQPLKEAA